MSAIASTSNSNSKSNDQLVTSRVLTDDAENANTVNFDTDNNSNSSAPNIDDNNTNNNSSSRADMLSALKVPKIINISRTSYEIKRVKNTFV